MGFRAKRTLLNDIPSPLPSILYLFGTLNVKGVAASIQHRFVIITVVVVFSIKLSSALSSRLAAAAATTFLFLRSSHFFLLFGPPSNVLPRSWLIFFDKKLPEKLVCVCIYV